MSQGVCALVGAGPGLGLAIAQTFGREGYQIALLARRPEALKEYTNTLSRAGIAASGFSVDAADPAMPLLLLRGTPPLKTQTALVPQPQHWLLQVPYFVIAGVAWAFPAKWLMFWAAGQR